MTRSERARYLACKAKKKEAERRKPPRQESWDVPLIGLDRELWEEVRWQLLEGESDVRY